MKTELKAKYLHHLLSKKKKDEGFTLIELLVVVIIIGVLAAVALPAMLGQVGKARETEIKTVVGSTIRGEQAFHTERNAFTANVGDLGIDATGTYLDGVTLAAPAGGALATDVTVISTNNESGADGTRAYSGAINFANGQYTQILCQSNAVANAGTVPAGAAACPGGTGVIK